MDILTVKLPNGLTVLANTDRHGDVGAATYVNQTQAAKKLGTLQAHGIVARIWQSPLGRVRFIVIA